jgi:hypothetical protein
MHQSYLFLGTLSAWKVVTILFLNFFYSDSLDVVKQSAAPCLLRLFCTDLTIILRGEWTLHIINLLNDQHLGGVTAAVSLIEALVKNNPTIQVSALSLTSAWIAF